MKPFMKKYPSGSSIIVLFCVVGLVFGVVPSVAHNPPGQLYTTVGKYDSEKAQRFFSDSFHTVRMLGSLSSPFESFRSCVVVDELCLVPEEVPNYEAIKTLHSQLDDDRSGDIDVTESVDFLKEELQYAKGYEKRQKVFHYNNDQYISVRELWSIWKKSEVHNWTVEQTVAWLAETVELKQYAQKFYENAVNGSVLPRTILSVITSGSERRDSRYMLERLAANNEQFLTKVLGIRDPKHRSKITIKAMDVVLFGPPKESGSHVKDLVLVTLLTLALIGCFKAYQRNREYEKQLSDMLTDMEKLREAEENLQQLELRMNSDVATPEADLVVENNSRQAEELQQLKIQLEQEREKYEQMKEQMQRGLEEAEMEDHHWSAPLELQHWLQLTYERERIAFEKKQIAAREQFAQAREMCEKLNHQRRSLMGVLASVHGKMDNVDQSISRARTILEEVTQELGEKNQRWKHIEILAGCSITTNAGLHTLELMLRPQLNGRPHSTYAPSIGCSSRLSASIDDIDDETLSLYTQTTVQQLLCNQSALMFLTMGGSSYYGAGSGSLNSSALIGTPRESMVDVRGSTGSTRKRNQLIARDSGSSLGSESSISQTSIMHHSHTFSTALSPQTEEETFRRVSSTGSIHHLIRRERECSKIQMIPQMKIINLHTSETASFIMEADLLSYKPYSTQGLKDFAKTKAFSTAYRFYARYMVGMLFGPLTLNSMSSTASPSQVSSRLTSPRPSIDSNMATNGIMISTTPKRSPMLKSLSQDVNNSLKPDVKLKEISVSEPALGSPKTNSVRSRKTGTSPSEEGNSSDSSERPPSTDSRKKSKNWFRNGITGSLKLGRSKKQKDIISEKEPIKEIPKI
ncbi:stromal interaction molecule homolog [Macrobrachium nipponense]|uniref:stromal interaction molecule homolog n=1 Tax=Macrobrachium nipponense TaxID=159736 RepID=UPI0030C7A459